MNAYDYSIYYKNWHNDSPEHHAKVSAWKADEISQHLSLAKDARILDVGCGFGFALGGLRLLGYHNISGVDQSPQQAEVCRKAGFDVAVTDDTVAWLNDRKQQFDAVLLFDVLEHVPVGMQIDFLRGIFACLKPGGILLLTVPNANAILSARWRYNDYTHFSSFTEHSISFVLQNAGFNKPWLDNNKGIGRFPRKFWLRRSWPVIRKWIIRWCWLQVFKAEQGYEPIDNICFELNLTALAKKES